VAAWLTARSDADAGIDWIQTLCAELAVPSLSHYGVADEDVGRLVVKAERASSMQGNPIVLTRDELSTLVRQAL